MMDKTVEFIVLVDQPDDQWVAENVGFGRVNEHLELQFSC